MNISLNLQNLKLCKINYLIYRFLERKDIDELKLKFGGLGDLYCTKVDF